MTLAIAALVACAAISGCVCTCVTATAEFETACREQGGRVQRAATSARCITDGGVVATWTVDEEDGGP